MDWVLLVMALLGGQPVTFQVPVATKPLCEAARTTVLAKLSVDRPDLVPGEDEMLPTNLNAVCVQVRGPEK